MIRLPTHSVKKGYTPIRARKSAISTRKYAQRPAREEGTDDEIATLNLDPHRSLDLSGQCRTARTGHRHDRWRTHPGGRSARQTRSGSRPGKCRDPARPGERPHTSRPDGTARPGPVHWGLHGMAPRGGTPSAAALAAGD